MADLFEKTDELDRQAQYWVIKLDDGSLNSQQRERLRHWLLEHEDHRQALKRARAVWQALDQCAYTAMQDPEGVPGNLSHCLAESSPGNIPGESRKTDVPFSWPGYMGVMQQRTRMGLSLSVFALIVLTAALQFFIPSEGFYRTAKGEMLAERLPDGSDMILNTDSVVEVLYTERERSLVLHEGEVFFTVAHNPARPFVVYSGNGKTRAVGTAFNVHKHDDRVSVTVTEGTVEIGEASIYKTLFNQTVISSDPSKITAEQKDYSQEKYLRSASGSAGETRRVTANQSLVYRQKPGVITDHSPQDVRNRLAWQRNKLHFNNASLEAFIEEFNRYNNTFMMILDADLKKIRVGGVFQADDPQAALKALRVSHNVETMHITPFLTLLYRKDSE